MLANRSARSQQPLRSRLLEGDRCRDSNANRLNLKDFMGADGQIQHPRARINTGENADFKFLLLSRTLAIRRKKPPRTLPFRGRCLPLNGRGLARSAEPIHDLHQHRRIQTFSARCSLVAMQASSTPSATSRPNTYHAGPGLHDKIGGSD